MFFYSSLNVTQRKFRLLFCLFHKQFSSTFMTQVSSKRQNSNFLKNLIALQLYGKEMSDYSAYDEEYTSKETNTCILFLQKIFGVSPH